MLGGYFFVNKTMQNVECIMQNVGSPADLIYIGFAVLGLILQSGFIAVDKFVFIEYNKAKETFPR